MQTFMLTVHMFHTLHTLNIRYILLYNAVFEMINLGLVIALQVVKKIKS